MSLVGATYGLRTFRVTSAGDLHPVTHFTADTWRGGWAIAKCASSEHHPNEPVPARGCRCGIYSWTDLEHLRAEYEQARSLVTVIGLEGRTFLGARGYRSSKARVVALWANPATIPDELRVRICSRLDEPVTSYSDIREMVSAYPGLSLWGAPARRGVSWWVRQGLLLLAMFLGAIAAFTSDVWAFGTPIPADLDALRTVDSAALLPAVLGRAAVVAPVLVAGLLIPICFLAGPLRALSARRPTQGVGPHIDQMVLRPLVQACAGTVILGVAGLIATRMTTSVWLPSNGIIGWAVIGTVLVLAREGISRWRRRGVPRSPYILRVVGLLARSSRSREFPSADPATVVERAPEMPAPRVTPFRLWVDQYATRAVAVIGVLLVIAVLLVS